MRATLERTAKQLNGETTIDKGVVSHILVNFVHAFIGRRREADEMLKLLSSLLGWNEEMQERIGLLPGPMNPRQMGDRKGILSRIWRKDAAYNRANNTNHEDGECGEGGSANEHRQDRTSLAELWVQFLLKESEFDSSKRVSAQIEKKEFEKVNHDSKNLGSKGVSTSNVERSAELPV
ncbi:unnamed protein product [Phytomonas sp. Hart1]|nr:unnamed protein product [Phytomonas sp. Hart1]|eukprot:CCW69328.1 unnamed protein product [Phytomonas sp. isolate Hart1]